MKTLNERLRLSSIDERLRLNVDSKITSNSNWEIGVEGTEVNNDVDIIAISMKDTNKKKYGFFCYNEDTDTSFIMNFDSIEDLQEAYCVDYGWEFVKRINQFEPMYDADSGNHMYRIW